MSQTIVITGASDGIGAAAAKLLAGSGNRLLLVGRSEAKLRAVAEPLQAEWFTADYEHLDQVKGLAATLRSATDRIDVLANNAGGVFTGPVRTQDGFERTFQVNHLAGFLLTHELTDLLLASRAAVVNTSSAAARMMSRLDLADPNTLNGFSSSRAYGNGKLANVLHAFGLHNRYHDQGLSAVAFHPGVIASNFASGTSGPMRLMYHSVLNRFLTKADGGGANLARMIAGVPGRDWASGEFYDDHGRVGRTSPLAYDPAVVSQFWEISNTLLGLSD